MSIRLEHASIGYGGFGGKPTPDGTVEVRVMEENGFVFIGEGSEEGVIHFAVSRLEFHGHQPPVRR